MSSKLVLPDFLRKARIVILGLTLSILSAAGAEAKAPTVVDLNPTPAIARSTDLNRKELKLPSLPAPHKQDALLSGSATVRVSSRKRPPSQLPTVVREKAAALRDGLVDLRDQKISAREFELLNVAPSAQSLGLRNGLDRDEILHRAQSGNLTMVDADRMVIGYGVDAGVLETTKHVDQKRIVFIPNLESTVSFGRQLDEALKIRKDHNVEKVEIDVIASTRLEKSGEQNVQFITEADIENFSKAGGLQLFLSEGAEIPLRLQKLLPKDVTTTILQILSDQDARAISLPLDVLLAARAALIAA